jgi:hypothetical protein
VTEASKLDRAACVSFDFDGVLSTLVLGRTWEKTRKKGRPVPLVSPAVRALKRGLAALTEGLRRPLPEAEASLRRLKASGRTLCLLTSRTGYRIAAAERWLERHGWADLFDRLYFNVQGEDADRFKAGVLVANAIDVHVDDDPETIGRLAGLLPDRLFVHLDYYRRRGPAADNVVTAHGWDEVRALFGVGSPPDRDQKQKARPA